MPTFDVHLTNKQQAALDRAFKELPTIVEQLQSLYTELDGAVESLPKQNEEGHSIVHRSNMHCFRRADEIEQAIRILEVLYRE